MSSRATQDITTVELYQPNLLPTGSMITSPGGSFQYEVIGSICRLYDLNELPYPCCRLSWRGKEPSWNRQGRRFVPDIATRKYANYRVRLLGGSNPLGADELDLTLYWRLPLSMDGQRWWTRNRNFIN